MLVRMFIESPEFDNFIKDRSDSIMGQVTTDIINISQFKILKFQYIDKLWASIKERVFILCISKENLEKLKFKEYQEFFKLIDAELNKCNNKILVNDNMEIIHCEKFLYDLKFHSQHVSSNNYCVFYINEDGVCIFNNGTEIYGANVFFDEKDLAMYSKRKSIGEIRDILELYKNQYLPTVNDIFFENNLEALKDTKYSNILKNKPEKIMKENLIKYLNKNLKHSFTANVPITNSTQVIDAFTEVDGEIYFINISWLGVSISECLTMIAEKHNEEHMKKFISNAIEAIEKLVKINGENFKCGYIVTFDARDSKAVINLEDYGFINEDQKMYIDFLVRIDEFKIAQKHIA
ncbi:MAG: hypothetical protein ACM3KR_05160 [Deltaproteobacteria bacterium]